LSKYSTIEKGGIEVANLGTGKSSKWLFKKNHFWKHASSTLFLIFLKSLSYFSMWAKGRSVKLCIMQINGDKIIIRIIFENRYYQFLMIYVYKLQF
jgi:hypothetical protein